MRFRKIKIIYKNERTNKIKFNLRSKFKLNLICSFLLTLIITLALKLDYIKVMYYISNNFGDNLNSFIFPLMTTRKVKFYNTMSNYEKIKDLGNIKKLDRLAKTDLFFIGSILTNLCDWNYVFSNLNNKYKSIITNWIFKIYDYFHPLKVFGAGFILDNKRNEAYLRNLKIIAVRGKITLERFIRNGIKVDNDVILADPGILAPIIFNMSSTKFEDRIHKLCIIPHCVEKHSSLLRKKIKVDGAIILNVLENPKQFVGSLSKCKRVLSSSLHGLVVSDSLGIPNMRIVLSNKIIGGDFKYNDYYSAYGFTSTLKIDLRKTYFYEEQLSFIDSKYNISQEMIIKKQCQLLIKFPYELNKNLKLLRNKMCKYIKI